MMAASHHTPVSVIINVFNEAAILEKEILEIHDKILSRLPGSELIVAEDGSTDGTKEIISKYVKRLGLIHSTDSKRKGYAQALKDAMIIAKNPYIFFSDSGGKFDFDDFWNLYPLCEQYALVLGIRQKRSDPFYRRLMTYGYNFLLRIYFHVDVKDSDSGFRIYKKILVNKLCDEDWVNKALIGSELVLRTLFSGGNIGYVPIVYKNRNDESRGLPPQTMFNVITGVLKNFPKLKRIISSRAYPKLIV